MKRMKKINLKNVDLIVYDFDGVMTDNKVLVTEDRKEAVFCHRGDGMAIARIKEAGGKQIILSSEKNKVLEARAQKLKVEAFYGVDDKRSFLAGYCKKKKHALKKVVYIGNDLNDLDAMKMVGYPLAPYDACAKVKTMAKVVFKAKGGEGVIREFLDKLV